MSETTKTISGNKYSVVSKDNVHVLKIEGRDSLCPVAPATLVPGHIQGTANMMRMPCNTQCPLACLTMEITGEGDNAVEQLKYRVSCGVRDMVYDVEPFEEPQQAQKSGILVNP